MFGLKAVAKSLYTLSLSQSPLNPSMMAESSSLQMPAFCNNALACWQSSSIEGLYRSVIPFNLQRECSSGWSEMSMFKEQLPESEPGVSALRSAVSLTSPVFQYPIFPNELK